jgi:hypothetical protein
MTYTWTELNRHLKTLRTESAVLELLEQQRKLGAYPRWLMRISARHRQLRKLRERREFEAGLRAYRGPRTKPSAEVEA